MHIAFTLIHLLALIEKSKQLIVQVGYDSLSSVHSSFTGSYWISVPVFLPYFAVHLHANISQHSQN